MDTKPLSPTIEMCPILVVDDTELNLIFLEKALRNRGFKNIVRAASAEEALKHLNETPIDIVLLDLLMPGGMDGFDCCKKLRQDARFVDLPVLVQTAATEPELRTKAFNHGATDFVTKPINPAELCARVRVHLENRCAMNTLQNYKNRTEAELESARQLQLDILPSPQNLADIEARSGLSLAAHFHPSSEIGGDIWGMQALSPTQTALWLVDFSGHGVVAAINVFRLHALLMERPELATRPGEYLSLLNDKLHSLLPPGYFATMFYGVIDTQNAELRYACSCIPSPILWQRETGKAQLIDGSGNLLGTQPHLYSTQTLSFAAGDLLVLYSDALIETPDASGAFLSEASIASTVERVAPEGSAAVTNALLSKLEIHAHGKLRDDLTLVACLRKP